MSGEFSKVDDGELRTHRDRRFWAWYVTADGKWITSRPPGDALAALRSGTNREPGSVPSMWPYYTQLGIDGPLSGLAAEHLALTLYGAHQQSKDRPMHRPAVGLGTAVLALRQSDKFSGDAVDRRFTAAATSTSMVELGYHLRGLVGQLRTIDQPLDYDRLESELRSWRFADSAARTRRRWGRDYFWRNRNEADATSTGQSSSATETSASAQDTHSGDSDD